MICTCFLEASDALTRSVLIIFVRVLEKDHFKKIGFKLLLLLIIVYGDAFPFLVLDSLLSLIGLLLLSFNDDQLASFLLKGLKVMIN